MQWTLVYGEIYIFFQSQKQVWLAGPFGFERAFSVNQLMNSIKAENVATAGANTRKSGIFTTAKQGALGF